MRRVLLGADPDDPDALADIIEALGPVAEALEKSGTHIDLNLALALLAIECDRRLRARAETT